MYTYFLVLLLSALASVFASSGDRKWLLNMMLGLPEDDRPIPPTYNPAWTPRNEDGSLSQASTWPLDEASDQRNTGDVYSIPGPISDFYSDPNVEKKWSRHAKFHFSGFICCNQPPTPHPKTKRVKGPNENLRSILLKGIAKSLARDRLLDKTELRASDGGNGNDKSDNFWNINYAEIDPRLLPLTADMSDDGYLGPENQLFPSIQRRGVTVRSKRGLPKYDEGILGPGRFGRKRSWDQPQVHYALTPMLVFETSWDVEPTDLSDNAQRSRRGNNSFKDHFRSVGGGR